MIEWIDLWSLLFGNDGVAFADFLILGRYIVSVTGVTSGLRYAEIVFDDVTSPGGTHGIQCGIVTVSNAAAARDGVCVSSSGRIWSLGAALDTPDQTNGPTFTAGQVAMFCANPANGKCWIGKVGTGWYGGGDPAAGTGQTATLGTGLFHLAAAIELDGSAPTGGAQFTLRTQASQFSASIPSGGSAWYT